MIVDIYVETFYSLVIGGGVNFNSVTIRSTQPQQKGRTAREWENPLGLFFDISIDSYNINRD